MKKQLPLYFLFALAGMLSLHRLYAQDVSNDLAKPDAKLETDFTKNFKVSFTGSEDGTLSMVMVTLNDGSPAILSAAANLKTFTASFTGAKDGSVTFKDSHGKAQKVTGGKLQFKVGSKAFVVTAKKTAVPAPPPAAAKTNAIVVDLKKPAKDYSADFSQDITVTFSNPEGFPNTTKVSLTTKTPPLTATLSNAADLSKYTLQFKSDKTTGALMVKDATGADLKVDAGSFTVDLGGKASFSVTNAKAAVAAPPKGADAPVKEKDKVPYWSYLENNKLEFSLEAYKAPLDGKCCDDCGACDDDAQARNNRIIYDAQSGLTYFVKRTETVDGKLCGDARKNYDKYLVDGNNPIRLHAGDPVVLIVKNANPALYDVELTDSSFLTNNESTALIESLLLNKSENAFSDKTDAAAIQGGDARQVNLNEDEKEYIAVKTGLLLVRSEMAWLLEYYRRSNNSLHDCIQAQKKLALTHIDGYPTTLRGGIYSKFSFIQLVDIFLNQETEDSVLNHQIKLLYSEFNASSYTISYPYTLPQKDMLYFHLSITAKEGSPYPSRLSQKKDATQVVYIKNFFKVDVSSGLYVGFMKDQTWALQPDTAIIRNVAGTADSITNTKRLVREDDGRRELGFASFLHIYYKYSNWCNFGATIGAGISFDKTVRPRYFTGVSLLLGTNNRVCINGGIVWGNYADLSARYKKVGNDYATLKDTETALDYTTRFKNAGFISISYNLPFLKRQTDAQAKPAAAKPAPPANAAAPPEAAKDK